MLRFEIAVEPDEEHDDGDAEKRGSERLSNVSEPGGSRFVKRGGSNEVIGVADLVAGFVGGPKQ